MKPSLVLHICCAPDEAWVVHSLKKEYNLHCFFCNPNISPQSEYTLRLEEAAKVAKHFGVPFTADEYDPTTWEEAIYPWRSSPEGGERCKHCFELRLRSTARFCASNGYSDFSTVMSISPHKQIGMLHAAGNSAAAAYNVHYCHFDFKKKDGFKNSIILSKSLGLYRQDYCGCSLSRAERDKRMQQRKHPEKGI